MKHHEKAAAHADEVAEDVDIEQALRTRPDLRDELWKVVEEDLSGDEVTELHEVIEELRSKPGTSPKEATERSPIKRIAREIQKRARDMDDAAYVAVAPRARVVHRATEDGVAPAAKATKKGVETAE